MRVQDLSPPAVPRSSKETADASTHAASDAAARAAPDGGASSSEVVCFAALPRQPGGLARVLGCEYHRPSLLHSFDSKVICSGRERLHLTGVTVTRERAYACLHSLCESALKVLVLSLIHI